MATEITVPQLGESVTEGSIGEWLKQPGDAVAVDQYPSQWLTHGDILPLRRGRRPAGTFGA